MSIRIREVKTKEQLRKFISFPLRFYNGHPNWLPPFYKDELNYFNTSKNKQLSPDFSDAIRKSRGRLFPFGALRIMRSMRNARKLVLLLGAIHPAYRGTGINALMGKSMLETARRLNYTHIDTHLVQESNLKYRAEVEKLNGIVNRRFRIFTKALQ